MKGRAAVHPLPPSYSARLCAAAVRCLPATIVVMMTVKKLRTFAYFLVNIIDFTKEAFVHYSKMPFREASIRCSKMPPKRTSNAENHVETGGSTGC